MKIWVSSLARVHDTASQVKPAKVVSLLGRGSVFSSIEGYDTENHHSIEVDDDRRVIEGRLTPADHHVVGLIDFLKRWDPDTPLLVHCWAGISRSSASAYIAACLHNPDADEGDIAQELADASPTAFPNTMIVSFADAILGRDGRMEKAVEKICADNERTTRIYMAEDVEPFAINARH